jgi:kynurenine 3-monooxygenase
MSVTGILGGGPAGLLMSILLARRGERVRVYERRADPRSTSAEAGRSINLALASRGIRALTEAGVMPALTPLLVPMRGRMLHDAEGHTQFVAYGQDPRESIYSISRTDLTRRLVEAAAELPGITLQFGQRCLGLDAAGEPVLRDENTGHEHAPPAARWIGADGAGSALRRGLKEAGQLDSREDLLGHEYKELTLPSRNGRAQLELEVLHIWPRGDFMLIALPNADKSFTLTLFMRPDGQEGFAALNGDAAVREFFSRVFPDVSALLPDLEAQFRKHPQSRLGTVYCDPWHFGERMLLIGDAAHAIVPFHGQGMNCAFEDCRVLDALLADDAHGDAFERFGRERKPDADAIAAMALENYAEMRQNVLDPRFQLQKRLSMELERRHPDRFIPRYSMVMFHDEIRYSTALARGLLQQQILDALTQPRSDGSLPWLDAIDWEKADALVGNLPPLER